MRMLIHGFKSLVRRPAKTIMFLVIFFIVFNLIFVGLIIQNSIKQSKEYIRNQIGGAVEYRMDFTAMIETMQMPGQGQGQGQATSQQQMMRPPSLSLSVAEKISNNQYVKNYFVTESANVNSDSIDPAQTETQLSGGEFMGGMSDFTLSGTNRAQHLDFALGSVSLLEGNTLTDSNVENGDYVAIISKDLADTNDLRIGDKISLARVSMQGMFRVERQARSDSSSAGTTGNNAANIESPSIETAESHDYEVIGIYEVVTDDFDINTIFTSNAVINEINGTSGSDETDGGIVFILDSPNHVSDFIQEATPYLTSEYHTLYANDEKYESLTKPLNLLSFITSVLIWVVFFAGVAIILAIATIFVRDRKSEIGLLLASGEGKLKIVSQFVFEMLVIAVIAFVISVGSSSLASQAVSGWIVDSQLLSQTSLIASTSSDTGVMGGIMQIRRGFMGMTTDSIYGNVDMQNVADKFDVSLNGSVVLNLMLISMLIVVIGSFTPLAVILGFKPKRILQDN